MSELFDEVLFDELPHNNPQLGVITLNRPKALNSLNLTMMLAMHQQLRHWKDQPEIKAVLIKAIEGRAFCAGGDLRATYECAHKKEVMVPHFFRDEYQLNRLIFHYPKPYIALLDGITMGGGVGISIHGSHRIGTEKLLFAMPETGIGFFPDVGGSYFLPRLPGNLGLYLGLTGARLGVDDCEAIGIVHHKVSSADLSSLIKKLSETPLVNPHADVSEIINSFKANRESSELLKQKENLDIYFNFDNIESIQRALESAGEVNILKWLAAKSPTSLKVTLMQLLKGKHLNFDECMQMEYRLANHFLANHDFLEGIRALIIDKDNQPHWHPQSLHDVTATTVAEYFSPLKQELNLVPV